MQFGVTIGEMERYKAALLRDSEQMASQGDSIASVDNLNLVMEYLALGHTYMNPLKVGIHCHLKLIDPLASDPNSAQRSFIMALKPPAKPQQNKSRKVSLTLVCVCRGW